jgi:hypothetical protein
MNRRSLLQLTAASSLAAASMMATSNTAWAQTFPIRWAGLNYGYFRGSNAIVVPTYHLTLITSQQATAVGGIGARARMTKVLSGIDEATLRNLTNEAHADLKARFVVAGLPVASDEQAQAIVEASGVARLSGNVQVVAMEAGGFTLNKSLKQGWVTVGAAAAPALAPFAYGANVQAAAGASGKLVKGQPENTLALMPHLVLDFASIGGSIGGGLLGRVTASVGGNTEFTLRGLASGILAAKALPRGYTFPFYFRAEGDYGVATPFATERRGAADVAPLMSVGNTIARGDAVEVNLEAWRGLVQASYRDYNAAIVAAVLRGK